MANGIFAVAGADDRDSFGMEEPVYLLYRHVGSFDILILYRHEFFWNERQKWIFTKNGPAY